MKNIEVLINSLSENIRMLFRGIPKEEFSSMEEIRLRSGKPLIIRRDGKEYFVDNLGGTSAENRNSYIVTAQDILATVTLMSGYSIYAYGEELKSGYITLQGGHRVGICGKTIVEKGVVQTIKNISALNIRVSHELFGCADKAVKYIINGRSIRHTLIVSPPRCGKTTLLRDLVRQISDGIKSSGFEGLSVGVVDERSEIAGSYMGTAQNDVGIRTDVLDCCPKSEGMIMLIRSMSPEVIAVDEIGKKEDIYAIEEIINAGIKLICTVHGDNITDIINKPELDNLLKKKIFERIIILSYKNGPGTIDSILDKNYNNLIKQ